MSDEVQGESLPRGATRRERSLDLLLEMNEPEELVLELRRVAEVKASYVRGDQPKIWETVAKHLADCQRALMQLNEPKAKDE